MEIINIGSLNIDKVYGVSDFVKAGETIAAKSARTYCGGKGLNQSVALARAGLSVRHAGLVGEDGEPLLRELSENGVDTGLVRRVDGPTGVAVIQVSDSGENSIIVHSGANGQIGREYIDEVLKSAGPGDLLVLQNEVSGVGYAMEHAKEKGLLIALTPAPVTAELMECPIGLADYLLLNEAEGRVLSGAGAGGSECLLEKLRMRFPGTKIVLTMGVRGAYYSFRGETLFQPSFRAKAVDTTASGDTFCGYFLAGTLRGDGVKKAMEDAACAAAISVTRKGAAASIPWRRELDERICREENRVRD